MLVVDAQRVEDRRVEVVDRCDVLDRVVAEVVGRAVAISVFDSFTGEPNGKPLRL